MRHDFSPKKLPRQARSRVTFDAIVEACARLLVERGYGAVTTNHIAEAAGVSIPLSICICASQSPGMR